MSSRLGRILGVAALLGAGAGLGSGADDPPYVARPLTRPGEFTRGIEGPGCDGEGNVYAVNFGKEGTIGRVSPETGRGEVFVALPGKSVGNGIVFDRRGRMYVADYVGHNVLRVDMASRKIEVFAHAAMNQPNDLAIAPDDTIYASDPDWANSKGRVWKVTTAGEVTRVTADMGTTNGIEVSPDGKTLYVNETLQRNVWAFPVRADGSLGPKRLLKKFDDFGMDGMRCDADGNLWMGWGMGDAAHDGVNIYNPDGRLIGRINLPERCANLCFGGTHRNRLFMAASKSVYALYVNTQGARGG
jgi:gluconolactonase